MASLGADLNELHDGGILQPLPRVAPHLTALTHGDAADVLLDVSAKTATVEEASLAEDDEAGKRKKAKEDHAELECE